jgi:hypothetical protein
MYRISDHQPALNPDRVHSNSVDVRRLPSRLELWNVHEEMAVLQNVKREHSELLPGDP